MINVKHNINSAMIGNNSEGRAIHRQGGQEKS